MVGTEYSSTDLPKMWCIAQCNTLNVRMSLLYLFKINYFMT